MAIFMTSAQAKEKISGLESRVEELENEIQARDGVISTLNEAAENAAALQSEIQTKDARIVSLEADLQTAKLEIKEANEKLETFDARVDQAAVQKVAAIGFQGNLPETEHQQEASTPTERAIQKWSRKF